MIIKTYFLTLFFILLFFPLTSILANFKDAKDLYLKNTEESYTHYAKIGSGLLDDELFFSAIPFFKEALQLKTNGEDRYFDKKLDLLIRMTGREHFRGLSEQLLQKTSAPSIAYILAFKAFKNKNNELASQYLAKIPKDHYLYPEALMLQASLLEFAGRLNEAERAFKYCIKYANANYSDAETLAEESAYEYIADACEIGIARTYYKAKKYSEASKLYRKIEKKSFKWPVSLLEESWASYLTDDLGKTLGRLYTYRSPLLATYFVYEADILVAISYLKLCLWDDALKSIKEFSSHYYSDAQRLQDLVQKNKFDFKLFLELITAEKNKEYVQFALLDNMLAGLKRRPFFINNNDALERIVIEKKKVMKREDSLFKNLLLTHLRDASDHQSKVLNQYIKKELNNIVNDIIKTHGFLGKIQLGIYSKQKRGLYQSKELIDENKVGSILDLERKTNQYYWGPVKEFWLDELGDYIFILKSQCPDEK